jgi:long-chain acyl-CoA synthetase
MASDPRLREHLEQVIEREVNSKLSRFETIKRIAILPEDFSVESGEMTPTLKVRRTAVEKKHAAIIESLYSEEARAAEGAG